MKEKVLIARCADYEPDLIAQVIGQGMDELGIVPKGRILIKPNIVIAHKFYFTDAFTRSEFIDGLLTAVKSRGAGIQELAVGERCGITISTRFAFSQSGYKKVLRKHKVKSYYFDECFQVERQLRQPDRLRDYIYVPQPVDECEFFISAPKLKSHTWTQITAALKNLMGLQDDRHRLIDHDYLLEHKIADLQEIIQPKFIAVDAIVAGEMKMLTPEPYPLGAILMGTNPVAVDAVACHIIGFDPLDVAHLRLSHERGYGPIDMAEIELGSDFPLAEIQKIAAKFRVPTERVDAMLNEKSNLTAYAGKPPDPEKMDYCWGGCPGALIEAMEIVRMIQPNVYQEVKPLHFVFGNYEGKINAKPWERVIFCGDCAQFKGTICDKPVEIQSEYVSRDKKDPHSVKSKDLMVRMSQFVFNIFRNRKNQVLRARGCPVSVAENVLFLWKPGGTKNPYFDSRVVFPFFRSYLVSKLANLIRILFRRRPK
jgi:uncharacterized protein (DUF362 family)